MARRNYTREILAELRDDRIAVHTAGGVTQTVTYSPRSKTDPLPFTDGQYRYNGREVHTVERCGQKMLNLSGGNFVHCTKPAGHTKACAVTR